MHTDISIYRKKNGLLQYLPSFFLPYFLLARIDRPVGVLLLLLPTYCGMALGSEPAPLSLYLVLALGALCARGAGCTYNDLLDVSFDAKVERTKCRPLPSGMVSKRHAILFLLMQVAGAASVLFYLRVDAAMLAMASIILVALYPLMKRWTYWPQLFLGFTFNWGVLVGAVQNSAGSMTAALDLYGAGILWTLCYDTVYANQDIEDDLKIGVKSLAIRLGARVKVFVMGCLAMMAVLLIALGYHIDANIFYYVMIVTGIGFWGILSLRIDVQNKEKCLHYFKRAPLLFVVIWVALWVR